MSTDIQSHVLEKIRITRKFALQLDESLDISGHSQLLANVPFVDGDTIRENLNKNPDFARHYQKKQPKRKFFGSHRNILTREDLSGKIVQVLALMERAHQRLGEQSEGKKPRSDCYTLFFAPCGPRC